MCVCARVRARAEGRAAKVPFDFSLAFLDRAFFLSLPRTRPCLENFLLFYEAARLRLIRYIFIPRMS
jgi:hypothetical protein